MTYWHNLNCDYQTTTIACPPGSHGNEFLKVLGGAAFYPFDGGNLRTDLKVDGGTMVFEPAT